VDHPLMPEIPDGLTEPARVELARYLRRYNQYAEEVKQVALTILVWGPSPGTKDPAAKRVADKRVQIRAELRRLGHNALFSEELTPPDEFFSARASEYQQALAAHLIIVLVEGSPGALGELHDFCGDPKLAPKLLVMVPRRYEGGYSGQGALQDLDYGWGGVYWYDDKEIENCNVLTRAVRRAEARRHTYGLRGGAPS
jgi:hypothetical protein